MQGESPLWVQVLTIILGPPIMACIWYVLFRLWAGMLGTTNRPWVQRWRRTEFWVLMGAMYVIGTAILIYAHFVR